MERLLRRLWRDRHADADMQQSGAVRWRCLPWAGQQVLHRTTLPTHFVWCALAEFANQDGDDSATL